MRIANRLGFDLSLISNGSRWTPVLIEEMAPILQILGLSIDAGEDATNRAIGRVDTRGRTPPVEELAAMIGLARSKHPALTVKINTVVNAANWHLDLRTLVERLAPDQWKVLRMLPSTNRNLEITPKQFGAFLDRHGPLRALMRVEDNEDMVSSYVMVDPHGRFFQNGQAEFGYAYSPPIIEAGARTAFQAITWSPEKFAARYRRRQ
jgi:radical S-adenosyl methionine domain-containing protein 2